MARCRNLAQVAGSARTVTAIIIPLTIYFLFRFNIVNVVFAFRVIVKSL